MISRIRNCGAAVSQLEGFEPRRPRHSLFFFSTGSLWASSHSRSWLRYDLFEHIKGALTTSHTSQPAPHRVAVVIMHLWSGETASHSFTD